MASVWSAISKSNDEPKVHIFIITKSDSVSFGMHFSYILFSQCLSLLSCYTSCLPTRLPSYLREWLFYRCRIHSTNIANTIHVYCDCMYFQVFSYVIPWAFQNIHRIEICAEWVWNKTFTIISNSWKKNACGIETFLLCLCFTIVFNRILLALYCLYLFICHAYWKKATNFSQG